MLRETLKQEIDQLNDTQLRAIAEFISLVKTQTQQMTQAVLHSQHATPVERAKEFRLWVAQLPKTNITLADEDFDRADIYE